MRGGLCSWRTRCGVGQVGNRRKKCFCAGVFLDISCICFYLSMGYKYSGVELLVLEDPVVGAGG